MIKIGLVDDHRLFLKPLRDMLNACSDFSVCIEANNGQDVQERMATTKIIPDIFLIDVLMPVMDGIATVKWLNQHYPAIKLVALSSDNTDETIIAMIREGCCAYLFKTIDPRELEVAINEIYSKGHYNSDAININYRRLLLSEKKTESLHITNNEIQFLQYACSDQPYKYIASQMNKSERTIDNYRESLFNKLHVKSRVGLALEAIRKGLVKL